MNWLKHDGKVEEELGLFSPEKGRCKVSGNTCKKVITKPESVSLHWFMAEVQVDLRESLLHQECQAV